MLKVMDEARWWMDKKDGFPAVGDTFRDRYGDQLGVVNVWYSPESSAGSLDSPSARNS